MHTLLGGKEFFILDVIVLIVKSATEYFYLVQLNSQRHCKNVSSFFHHVF